MTHFYLLLDARKSTLLIVSLVTNIRIWLITYVKLVQKYEKVISIRENKRDTSRSRHVWTSFRTEYY